MAEEKNGVRAAIERSFDEQYDKERARGAAGIVMTGVGAYAAAKLGSRIARGMSKARFTKKEAAEIARSSTNHAAAAGSVGAIGSAAVNTDGYNSRHRKKK